MVQTIRLCILLFAGLTSGCLVITEPVSYEPTQSPPIIMASGLSPDPREILRIGGDEGADEIGITASIISEDAETSVKFALYVDYGVTNALEQPFRFSLQTFPELTPGTMAGGPRSLVGVRWVDGVFPIQPGCHRLTLVATHAFDTASGCPEDLSDSSQVTWHFRQCDVGECPQTLVDCPDTSATCPLVAPSP